MKFREDYYLDTSEMSEYEANQLRHAYYHIPKRPKTFWQWFGFIISADYLWKYPIFKHYISLNSFGAVIGTSIYIILEFVNLIS